MTKLYGEVGMLCMWRMSTSDEMHLWESESGGLSAERQDAECT